MPKIRLRTVLIAIPTLMVAAIIGAAAIGMWSERLAFQSLEANGVTFDFKGTSERLQPAWNAVEFVFQQPRTPAFSMAAIDFREVRDLDELCRCFHGLTRVDSLRLYHATAEQERRVAETIAALRPTNLMVIGCAACDEFLQTLGESNQVHWLLLGGCTPRPNALQGLSHFKELSRLSLQNMEIDAGSWQALDGLSALTFLNLTDCQGGSLPSATATVPPQLKELCLWGTELPADWPAWAAKMTELRSIGVERAALDGCDFAPLAALPHLESLDLENCGLADEVLSRLPSLPELGRLGLNDNPVTNEVVLDAAARMPKLVTLSLANTRCTPDAFEELQKSERGVHAAFSKPKY